MSNIINTLELLASDALYTNDGQVIELINSLSIEQKQREAILEKDSDKLAKTISDLPDIKAFAPVIPAEDDEPEEAEDDKTKNINHAVNF